MSAVVEPTARRAEAAPAPSGEAGAGRAAPAGAVLAAAAATTLAACGGGGEGAASAGTAGDTARAEATAAASRGPGTAEAARFLAQASLSSTRADIASVQELGFSGWLDRQMDMPRSLSRVDWLRSKGLDAPAYRRTEAGGNNMAWRKLIASPDALRQRVTFALSEILVINMGALTGINFRAMAAASFLDILEANAFGNYRTLLEQVSTSPAMGGYLTFKGNRRAVGPSLPDENYARELMQLFTIGVTLLRPDGTPELKDGLPQDSYDQNTVSQMARVFTGWDLDTSVGTPDTPDRVVRPMIQYPARHELGPKLMPMIGLNIEAGVDGVASLGRALDALMKHQNTAPFIGRQLIQRLVTSDPSPDYVARVAAVFANNGSGVRGDLRAVVRAILLDAEARGEAGLSNPAFGKLREPVLRFVQWARSFGLDSPDDSWAIGDLSDPSTRLGQSPARSPSVFNFFRPGYVPPNSPIGNRTVPEFQITTESSVSGYVNFMQQAVAGRGVVNGYTLDYTALRAKVADVPALLDELNIVLAAGQLSKATLQGLVPALQSIDVRTPSGQNSRLYAALTLVLAAPEYITLK